MAQVLSLGYLLVDGSEATFFGALSAVGALAGCAGYYVGSWLILHRPAFEMWAVFGAVGLLGSVLARTLLRTDSAGAPAAPR
ncbi:hypothetical protein OVY01_04560 [Robbsia sp. Bb-Pol-6]|uniref:Uncharacterized protein n=1 Tax=Robbsia betulipollinis TaxID=2981849 RepID=A0ABT3ZJ24_9BURK|nr:hypothetical protein [Robbsia betulipollinis]MCY0386519.1 hypothetical protein [Robbsia betulipollinis]